MKKKIITIVVVILIILALLVVGAFALFHHYYSKLNYDNGQETRMTMTLYGEEEGTEETDSPQEVIDEADQAIADNLANDNRPLFEEDLYTVLLIGEDSRDPRYYGRSDSMILLTVNTTTQQISMISIMRDCYVAIPGHGNSRINHAYAWGGVDLLERTIEQNFGVQIDNYVSVNFFTFMDIVDALGGVDIEITDSEINTFNMYISELNRLTDVQNPTNQLSSGGTYHMNGHQALAYSRIRYVGNGDFQRTERQRYVLTQISKQIKDASLDELNDMLNAALPYITTDIDETRMMSLLFTYATVYRNYEITEYRVPCDGAWHYMTVSGMSVLGLDFPTNLQYVYDAMNGQID